MRNLVSVAVLFAIGLLSACTPPKAVLKSSAQVLAELQPYYKISKPSGAGPFPTVIVLHGASDHAWYAHFEEVTKKLADEGFASVFVDSYGERGISGQSLQGGRLLPSERAGDLLVTLQWLKGQSWARQGAVGALGYSHGAATIMDSLVLAPPMRKPTGLKDPQADALSNLKAAVLFYPFCSSDIAGYEITKAYDEDWSMPLEMLAFLPGSDQVSDMKLCGTIFDRHKKKGLPITTVDLPGVGHTFDQVNDDHGNTQNTYDAKAKSEAYANTIAFFRARLLGAGPK